MKATTDSIFRVGFGIELDNMNGSNEEGVKFSRAFDDANAQTYRRYFDISWKIKKFLNIGDEARLKKNMKVIDEFIYKVIQIKIAQMQKSTDDSLVSYFFFMTLKYTYNLNVYLCQKTPTSHGLTF